MGIQADNDLERSRTGRGETPVTPKGRAMRAALLRAAVDCFDELGYSGTDVGQITKRVGTSHSNFYGYFDSVEDVLIAAIDPVLDELHEVVRTSAVDTTTVEGVESWVRTFNEHYVPHRRLIRSFREAMHVDRGGSLDDQWERFRRPFLGQLTSWVEHVRASYEIEDLHLTAEELASGLRALHEQLLLDRIDPLTDPPDPNMIAHVSQLIAVVWFRAATGMNPGDRNLTPGCEAASSSTSAV